MNFLSMARAVREIVGMQGNGPATTTNAVGPEAVLVSFVRDAYIDIQNLRDDFDFLNAKGTFNTSIGNSEYSLLNIFGSSTPDFKKYDKDSFRITRDGKKLVMAYKDREALELYSMNSSNQNVPRLFTIDYSDQSLILHPAADAIYTVDFRYWKNPEILSTEGQVPKLPSAFHLLIVYKAVEKMAIYLGAQSAYSEYSLEAARMIGQLMRSSLRSKRLRTGAFV